MNNSNDAAFDSYKERFVEALWQQYPGWASSVGYHKYDSILIVPDAAARNKEIAFCKSQLDSLKQFDDNNLSDNNKIDKAMMRNQLESSIWSVNEEKSYEWNPAQYNVSEGFADILNGTYDSLDNRLRNIGKRLAAVPAFYEAAKQNIKNPTVEHTQLAIEQNMGGASVLEQDLPAALQKSHLPEAEKTAIKEKAAQAATAMKGYADWLKNLKNDQPRSFRLGKDLYAKKFDFDIQSGYTVDEIYKKAQEHKQELHTKMAALAKPLRSK